MFSISTVILTHNDQHQINKAIDSVSFCDQIIVVDDNSTDRTPKIAAQLGAKVYKRNLNWDFASQRNFGLTKTKNAWVLFIDPDERVSKKLQTEIITQIHNNPNVNGFYFHRQDFFLGKNLNYGETANTKLLRLAKKSAGNWTRPVHEVWQIKGPTTTLTHPLLHRPHPTISNFLADVNHYTTIEAGYRKSQGENFSFFQALIFPKAKFFQNYFLRLGFLDGFPGLVVAFVMAFHSLVVRIKLYEKNL